MYPASYAQRRLWFLAQLEGPSATYNLPTALRFRGVMDVDALRAALGDVLARHESLRTVFRPRDDEPMQVVLPVEQITVPLTVRPVVPEELEEQLAVVAGRPFDLEHDLPIRAELLRLGPEDQVLVLVAHHIAADGWSFAPLARDLTSAYQARCAGRPPDWAPLPVQYVDYTLWQQQLLGAPDDPGSLLNRQLGYWRDTLAGIPDHLALPTDRPRPPVASHRGATLPFTLPAGLHADLLTLARRHDATLFMVIHAGLAALLTRMGAGTDIPIGAPVAGRTDPGLDDLVGFFVNTLVLRTRTQDNPTFAQLLAQTRTTNVDAYAHQDLPFDHLVEALNPDRSLARHPLFQVALAFQNFHQPDIHLPGTHITAEPVPTDVAPFDLALYLTERHGPTGVPAGIEGQAEYATDLFDPGTVDQLLHRLERLLAHAAQDPGTPVGDLDIWLPGEHHRVLSQWNDTTTPLDPTTLTRRFEQQAAKTPDAIAVTDGTTTLTYRQLNEQANQLAHHLLTHDAGPEKYIALAIPRSTHLLTALLATLK
ncbi:condensation domain-containing protein, partial [Sphaerisporangium sp. B11E5]|uniref:condensation domain-containing protein n=1 Tax=Sphaerisporangium sp. B11E5 TaxID=3153563 RepID=UPI00325F6C63